MEAITHGVETLNLCEINVDVAKVGTETWSLKTDEGAQAKMNGNWRKIHDFEDWKCVTVPLVNISTSTKFELIHNSSSVPTWRLRLVCIWYSADDGVCICHISNRLSPNLWIAWKSLNYNVHISDAAWEAPSIKSPGTRQKTNGSQVKPACHKGGRRPNFGQWSIGMSMPAQHPPTPGQAPPDVPMSYRRPPMCVAVTGCTWQH